MNENKKNYLNLSKAKECKNNNKKLINDWQKYTHTQEEKERMKKKQQKFLKIINHFKCFRLLY